MSQVHLMATCSEEETRRKNYGKELPPITLSTASISSLVTLIPVLVSLTSQGQSPRFEDENDKPVWWPTDVQWQNPKSYSAYMGGNILKRLRRVVHSCYSYHGVEDLLCRLDETTLTEAEEVMDDPIITIDISETNLVDDDGPASVSSSSDNLVFVCCFCLEEFNSHEEVTCHQNVCLHRTQVQNLESESQPSPGGGSKDANPVKSQPSSVSKSASASPYPVSLHISNGFTTSDPVSATGSKQDSVRASPDNRLSSSAEERTRDSRQHKPWTGSSKPANNFSTTHAVRRQPQPSHPFVPTLKTRSQKKLDSIMEKHNSRKLMLKECQQMKGVAEKGAWWARKHQRKASRSHPHPSRWYSKESFLAGAGLKLKIKTEQGQEDSQKASIDLDCEIILVEGPLSSQAFNQENSHSSSPRGSCSIMSQLSRDTDVNSRRRLSFCFVEDEWADKEALEEGRDPLQMSLLSIAPSSPLGQRIRKYVKADSPLTIIKDPEVYCKTEIKDDSYSRLRFRAMDHKVTFRKKCRGSRFVHTYKFNRAQVDEFKIRLKTGLTARSRRLQCIMKPFRVSLKRLTESEIKTWTEEKKVSITENIVFDDDICLTQIEIPESKVRGYISSNAKSSTHPSSHHSNPSLKSQQQHQHQLQQLQQQLKSHHHHHHHRHHHQHHHHRPSAHFHQSIQSNQLSSVPGKHGHQFSSHNKSGSGLSPSLYLNHMLSSPHVPNIFRNRGSLSASCPEKSSKNKHQFTHSQSQHGLHRSSPLFGRQNHEREGIPRHSHPSFKSQLKKPAADRLSPSSGGSSSPTISERRPLMPNSNGSSRRKQPMTQVRQDEQEIKALHNIGPASTHSKSEGFLNLSTLSSKSSTLFTSSSSSSSSTSSYSSPRNNNAQHHQSDLPKLSNFEYFSIRQGQLSTGHSLPVNGIRSKGSSCPSRTPSSIRSSDLPTKRNTDSSIPKAQNRPSVISTAPGNRGDLGSTNPRSSCPSQLMGQGRTHSPQGRNHAPDPESQKKQTVSTDDDVLEVICID